jgi:hypothetical protein
MDKALANVDLRMGGRFIFGHYQLSLLTASVSAGGSDNKYAHNVCYIQFIPGVGWDGTPSVRIR